MQNLVHFIKEALINKHSTGYKYCPESLADLKDVIQKEFNKANYNLNCIDTHKITDMHDLFTSFNISEENQAKLNVSNWDMSNVKFAKSMFKNLKKFNCNLSNWDVINLENALSMFSYCESLDCDLSKWNTKSLKDGSFMFNECSSLDTTKLENWNVEKLKHKTMMFKGCKNKPSWA